MLNQQEMQLLVDVQHRSYRLLKWMESAVADAASMIVDAENRLVAVLRKAAHC